MPALQLSVRSLTPPALPALPTDTQPSDIPSGLIPGHAAAATSPLRFTLSLPGAHPATHLQLVYAYPGSGDVFVPNVILPDRLVKTDGLKSFDLAKRRVETHKEWLAKKNAA